MKALIAFVTLIICAHAIVCPPDFCTTVKCAQVESCEPGYLLQNGGFCGCCPMCHKILGRQEICSLPFIGGPPPNAVCGKGLVCIDGRCQAVAD